MIRWSDKTDKQGFLFYRRRWASERKALPSNDVAHAGGWKDIETMLGLYVPFDAATVLRVVENSA